MRTSAPGLRRRNQVAAPAPSEHGQRHQEDTGHEDRPGRLDAAVGIQPPPHPDGEPDRGHDGGDGGGGGRGQGRGGVDEQGHRGQRAPGHAHGRERREVVGRRRRRLEDGLADEHQAGEQDHGGEDVQGGLLHGGRGPDPAGGLVEVEHRGARGHDLVDGALQRGDVGGAVAELHIGVLDEEGVVAVLGGEAGGQEGLPVGDEQELGEGLDPADDLDIEVDAGGRAAERHLVGGVGGEGDDVAHLHAGGVLVDHDLVVGVGVVHPALHHDRSPDVAEVGAVHRGEQQARPLRDAGRSAGPEDPEGEAPRGDPGHLGTGLEDATSRGG